MDENNPINVASITEARLRGFTERLREYKTGKASVDRRIIAAEEWWKLRNDLQESLESEGVTDAFRSRSGWLHNVIVSKHADAMEAFPEPNILPREEGDKSEAKILSAIIPCVLEMNHFERTYSAAMWQKLKTGTGIYKVIWDKTKLNGLGDIAISRVNTLNVFWEPGIEDIQDSPYFFQTELADNEMLERLYPQLKGKLKGTAFLAAKFLYDDTVKTDGKSTVIEVYYHGEGGVLHYCKYVGETVLFATEDDPEMAERGLYDHKLFPFVFDPLFPVEGSPCGYGFVDLCRSAQTEIDLMKSAIVNNTMAGAIPRYFVRSDGQINEDEFLNLNKTLVHVNGNLGEDSIRPVEHARVDGAYINFLDRTIQELRETSGNTETSTGTASGVTAASAIAALQEASGKGSRDSTKGSWRAYRELVGLCIELNRQFYDLPRQFRIMGESGAEQFVSYSNQGLKPQPQGTDFGVDMGFRLPVFDIKISAQKANAYTRMAQNELSIQFFQMGFFNPQMADQALLCLGIMDFDGKDALMQKIAQNGTMFQTLQMVMQFAAALAAKYGDAVAMGQLQQIIGKVTGQPTQMGAPGQLMEVDAVAGVPRKEHALVAKARERSNNASQPGGGK